MKKKLAAIAMATAMAASLAACSSKPAETTAAAEENEETTAEAAEGSEAAEAGDSAFAGKTLIMSTNAEFAPYEYHDGNDIVGIDVDIANAICEDMGASLEITDVAFDSIIPEVQSGKADFAAAGMTVTEDRQTQVDFSDTYATGVQSVIVTEDSDIASLDDLRASRSAFSRVPPETCTPPMISARRAYRDFPRAQMQYRHCLLARSMQLSLTTNRHRYL